MTPSLERTTTSLAGRLRDGLADPTWRCAVLAGVPAGLLMVLLQFSPVSGCALLPVPVAAAIAGATADGDGVVVQNVGKRIGLVAALVAILASILIPAVLIGIEIAVFADYPWWVLVLLGIGLPVAIALLASVLMLLGLAGALLGTWTARAAA